MDLKPISCVLQIVVIRNFILQFKTCILDIVRWIWSFYYCHILLVTGGWKQLNPLMVLQVRSVKLITLEWNPGVNWGILALETLGRNPSQLPPCVFQITPFLFYNMKCRFSLEINPSILVFSHPIFFLGIKASNTLLDSISNNIHRVYSSRHRCQVMVAALKLLKSTFWALEAPQNQ